MRALKLLGLLLLAMLLAASAQAQTKPWAYDVYGPGGNWKPGAGAKWLDANLCGFVTMSCAPDAPVERQKQCLGECPHRSVYTGWKPGERLVGRLPRPTVPRPRQ